MRITIKYLLVCFLLSLNLFFSYYIKLISFDTQRIINDINFLSSDNLKGRLAGSFENNIAGEFIKESFISSNLIPYKDSLHQSFQVDYPKLNSTTPTLEVLSKDNNIIKTYKYGLQYKEDFINFRTNRIKFSIKDTNITESSILVKTDNSKIVLFVPKNEDFNFRSSFIANSSLDMYIMITASTYKDILLELNKGNKINLSIPYEIQKTEVDNITALHKGIYVHKPSIIITAHFDHIGSDNLGNIYNGALDNASGTAFLIELSRYVNKLGPADKDIIFVAFNAEEFGCLGSKAFVDRNYNDIKNSKIYNFDMIGSDKSIPLSLMGGKNDSEATNLIKDLSQSFRDRNISYNHSYEDSSDHEYFRKMGIEAVTFCQEDIERIHSTRDKSDFIGTSSIKDTFNAFSKVLIKESYKENLYIYYNYPGLIISLLFSFLLTIFYLKAD